MERSPAFVIIKQKLEREFRVLEEKQVTPWAFFNVAKPFQVSKFDGGMITYQGLEFSGSCRLVFWGSYIRLFLEDIVDKSFTETRKFCIENNLTRHLPLEETSKELQRGCSLIYQRMAAIDQRLRGKGFPKSVPKRAVDDEVNKMNEFIFARLKSEMAMAESNKTVSQPQNHNSWANDWYSKNTFWIWVIGTVVAIAGIIATLLS